MSFPYKTARTRASAFTLVELMIVIAIIGVLASLVTVGVMKALEKAKLVNLRLEIGQLEAAVAAAKLDLNNLDELPSVIYVLNNIPNFASQTALPTEAGKPFETYIRQKTWLTFQKAFGRNLGKHPVTNTYFLPNSAPVTINWPCDENRIIQGMEAYMFWLGGNQALSSGKTQFLGFSTDKRDPCEPNSTKRKGPYFEFDSGRVKVSNIFSGTKTTYVNGWDGEYTFFSSGFYKSYFEPPTILVNGVPQPNPKYHVAIENFGKIVSPYYNGNVFYNAKTFQIINSGKDTLFGHGGTNYTPGLNDYLIDAIGYDDMSNFSSTILGKKDE